MKDLQQRKGPLRFMLKQTNAMPSTRYFHLPWSIESALTLVFPPSLSLSVGSNFGVIPSPVKHTEQSSALSTGRERGEASNIGQRCEVPLE